MKKEIAIEFFANHPRTNYIAVFNDNGIMGTASTLDDLRDMVYTYCARDDLKAGVHDECTIFKRNPEVHELFTIYW